MKQLLPVLVLVLASVSARGAAAQYETVDGVRWAYTVTNGEATIGAGDMTPAVDAAISGALRVPEEIGGCPVVALDRWCFYKCPNITSVEVPDGVRSLGYLCFGDCTALESVRLPVGLTATPDSLFKGCTSLKSGEIPQSVTSFGRDCFWGCSSLTNAVIPRNLTVLPPMTFYNCVSLKTVELPPNLTELGVSSFSWCTGLESIEIPDTVAVIGSSAFEKCESLTELKLPSALTCINGIVGRCTGLRSFTVPRDVVSIADGALSGLTGLDRFDVEEGNGVFRSLDGILCEGDKLIAWPLKKIPVVIPDGIREIGACVFQNDLDLKDIVIPESVGVIGARAFSLCTELRSVTILHPNVTIGDYAFFGDFQLSSLVLAERAGSVGYNAFLRCTGLRIPSGATSLPVDLNARREGHPEPVAEWMFDKPPETAHAWYEIADFGLVGDENDNWVSWYQSDDPQTGGGYLAFDSFRGIRFPISEDLRTHDVLLSFRMKFIPLEECPALADSRLSMIEVHPVIRIVECQVGVKDRFWLFAVVDNPDYVEEVRLGVLSDRAYITDTRLPWRYVNYRTDVDWCDLVVRMDEDGFTLLCNRDTVVADGMKKFPYATSATDTKVDGMSLLGYGNIDNVEVERIQHRTLVRLPEKMEWGLEACVPKVVVYDPLAGTLAEGVDYVLSVSDNTSLGTAHVTVTGIGFYTGTLEETFEVVRGRTEMPEVLEGLYGWRFSRDNPFVYDGKAGDVSFFVSNVVTEAEISVSGTTNAVDAGSYRATAKGRLLRVVSGEYRDTVYVTEVDSQFAWAIHCKPFTSDSIELSIGATNFWTTGNYIPAPRPTSVYDRDLGRKLTYISEYTIAGTASQKGPGTYTVMVSGMGNYSGILRYAWRIVDPAVSTEIGGVSVPNTWLREKGIAIAGGIEAALSAQTGKMTASGHTLSVWEEYVQGTDPNDPDDRFEVNVTIVDGKPVVTYTPDLGEERTYTILGSTDLKTWKPAEEGDGSRYFKVKVDLK